VERNSSRLLQLYSQEHDRSRAYEDIRECAMLICGRGSSSRSNSIPFTQRAVERSAEGHLGGYMPESRNTMMDEDTTPDGVIYGQCGFRTSGGFEIGLKEIARSGASSRVGKQRNDSRTIQ